MEKDPTDMSVRELVDFIREGVATDMDRRDLLRLIAILRTKI